MIFESERLIFRQWQQWDLEPFAKMNMDSEVMAFFPNMLTKDQTEAFMYRIMDHHEVYGYGLYAVELKDSGEFIGFIGFAIPHFDADFMPCIEIGWRLDKKYWHHGYATEGAEVCLDYGFNVLDFDEIVSFTSKVNQPSIQVMKRIGMSFDRTFEHPKIEDGHRLKTHVLYRIRR